MDFDALVLRQGTGCETSDFKQREEYSRCRRRSLEDRRRQNAGGKKPASTRIQGAAIAQNLHSQEEWQETPPEHSHNV